MDPKKQLLDLKRRLEEIKTARRAKKSGRDFTDEISSLLTEEGEQARRSIDESPTTKAIKTLAAKIPSLEKKDPRIGRIMSTMRKANGNTQTKLKKLDEDFRENISALLQEVRSAEQRGTEMTASEVEKLSDKLDEAERRFQTETNSVRNESILIQAEVSRVEKTLNGTIEGITGLIEAISEDATDAKNLSVETQNALEKLERDILSRFATFGGGNMNRNIAVGGNQSVLSMFTDINFKAGSGVTITYAPNLTTGFTDITIAANGTGTGIVREINSVAVPTVMGNTAGTDYVYLVSGTTTMTLPTAVGNENLYTVKNVGNGVITIDTTGGQTIDNEATISMATRYTSVDIISDGSNWNIT